MSDMKLVLANKNIKFQEFPWPRNENIFNYNHDLSALRVVYCNHWRDASFTAHPHVSTCCCC